jgi:hypothetical protein
MLKHAKQRPYVHVLYQVLLSLERFLTTAASTSTTRADPWRTDLPALRSHGYRHRRTSGDVMHMRTTIVTQLRQNSA